MRLLYLAAIAVLTTGCAFKPETFPDGVVCDAYKPRYNKYDRFHPCKDQFEQYHLFKRADEAVAVAERNRLEILKILEEKTEQSRKNMAEARRERRKSNPCEVTVLVKGGETICLRSYDLPPKRNY